MEVLVYPSVRAFTVWYDRETGEVDKIEEAPVFKKESLLIRTDVLKDTVVAFTERYAEARVKWVREAENNGG
tara:strand:- start:2600 stop:2815 length:216 start_codon:yes stop_codon:yes gene_type:complete